MVGFFSHLNSKDGDEHSAADAAVGADSWFEGSFPALVDCLPVPTFIHVKWFQTTSVMEQAGFLLHVLQSATEQFVGGSKVWGVVPTTEMLDWAYDAAAGAATSAFMPGF